MKYLIVKFAKKYIIDEVNEQLSKYKDDIPRITLNVSRWSERLEKILSQLKLLNDRLSDGNVSSDELEKSIDEITLLIKQF